MNKVSDYIEFDTAQRKGFQLLKDDKKFRIGFYIIVGINTGLRVSDLLKMRFGDFKSDKLVLTETKTKKQRIITINTNIKKAYDRLSKKFIELNIDINDDDYIFVSQKGMVYNTQSINYILKQVFNTKKLQISNHSLRKSFGRRVYEINNDSENALVLFSDIFNHSNLSITRRYLGIRQETISNVYLAL